MQMVLAIEGPEEHICPQWDPHWGFWDQFGMLGGTPAYFVGYMKAVEVGEAVVVQRLDNC